MNQSNLEQLTQKIIKAVPSKFRQVYFGGGNNPPESTAKQIDIDLEDVLIAISKIKSSLAEFKVIPFVTKDCFTIILAPTGWGKDDKKIYIEWLLNTPLHLQGDETISEINKLIK